MLTLMLMLATPAYTVPPRLAVLAGLQGCWRVSGQVQGKDSPSIARGEWHLGRRYFPLRLRATGSDPYEAAITYGTGEQPRAIGSVFSDTFGGLYEPSLGLGELPISDDMPLFTAVIIAGEPKSFRRPEIGMAVCSFRPPS